LNPAKNGENFESNREYFVTKMDHNIAFKEKRLVFALLVKIA
jgi:hypothetical protein